MIHKIGYPSVFWDMFACAGVKPSKDYLEAIELEMNANPQPVILSWFTLEEKPSTEWQARSEWLSLKCWLHYAVQHNYGRP